MNHKQKLGYMALGAGILALGIMIGQFVTPDIEAQSNGVFDEITCRQLKVVDRNGKTGIDLFATEEHAQILIRCEAPDTPSILLSADTLSTRALTIYNGVHNDMAISFSVDELSNRVEICDIEGNNRIELRGSRLSSDIYMMDNSGKAAISLAQVPSLDRNSITVWDPATNESFRFNAYRDRNELVVYDKSSGAGIGFYGDSNEAKQTRWSGD